MSLQSALREAMMAGDAQRVVQLQIIAQPHTAPAKGITEAEAKMILHTSRTGAEFLPLEKRLYSHHWLSERGFRSELPDELRPKSEKMESIVVRAVGVAVKSLSSRLDRVEESDHIEKLMARAAGDCHRDGIYDRERVVARMWEARDLYIKGLLKKEI